MRVGVIDVGSNTIRTVIAQVEEKGFEEIWSQGEYAGLLSFVSDGELEPEGRRILLETLERMAAVCRMAGCDRISPFATASLRGLKDPGELAEAVRERTGLTLRLLTGREEALCDLLGLRWETGARQGAGLDLGGGSCQVFAFREDSLLEQTSVPCGSLALYCQWVAGTLPTPEERERIRRFVLDQLGQTPALEGAGRDGTWAMGGTARAACRLWNALEDIPRKERFLTRQELEELPQRILAMGEEGAKLLAKTVPQRLTTILPGVEALAAVCDFLKAPRLEIARSGVREGYLRLLTQQHPPAP